MTMSPLNKAMQQLQLPPTLNQPPKPRAAPSRGVRRTLTGDVYVVLPEEDNNSSTGSISTSNGTNRRRAINASHSFNCGTSFKEQQQQQPLRSTTTTTTAGCTPGARTRTVSARHARLPEAQGLCWTDDYFEGKQWLSLNNRNNSKQQQQQHQQQQSPQQQRVENDMCASSSIIAVFDLDYTSMAWDLEKLGYLVFAILLGYVFDFAMSNPLLWLVIAFARDDPNLPRLSWYGMSLFSLVWFAICYLLSSWTSRNNMTDTTYLPHVFLVIVLILSLLYWRFHLHRMIRSQHVAVTRTGICFVNAQTSEIVHLPLEEITDWEIIKPPGNSTVIVHIYNASDSPEKPRLSIWGLRHPLKFKRLVRALAKLPPPPSKPQLILNPASKPTMTTTPSDFSQSSSP